MTERADPSPSSTQPQRFTFRRLTDADLSLMHRWLNEPGVLRWWEGDDVSWDGVVAKYGDGRSDTCEDWLAVLDGEPVGWLGCGAAADEPEEYAPWLGLGLDPTAGGIDYLVGDPAARGRGLGAAMIAAFVEQVAFGRHPGWTQAAANPLVANVASWRALASAGFRHVGDHDDPLGPCRLMAVDRRSPR